MTSPRGWIEQVAEAVEHDRLWGWVEQRPYITGGEQRAVLGRLREGGMVSIAGMTSGR